MIVVDEVPNIHSYWMTIAIAIAARSTCIRRHCGAILVLEDNLISSGYNGTPRKFPHCRDIHPTEGCYHGHLAIQSGSEEGFLICKAVHAETNAIYKAAANGISVMGAHLYTTNEPCRFCMEAIIQARIGKIYYCESYEDNEARHMRDVAGVKAIHVKPFEFSVEVG